MPTAADLGMTDAELNEYRKRVNGECPTKRRRKGDSWTKCRCEPCVHCGHGPHMAIHKVNADGTIWGHRYER